MVGDTMERLEGAEGEVKWFDSRKGFGFLVGPEGQDIFVHYSVIDGAGYRSLRDGTTVEYNAEKTDKGWKASKVVCHTTVESASPQQSQHVVNDLSAGGYAEP